MRGFYGFIAVIVTLVVILALASFVEIGVIAQVIGLEEPFGKLLISLVQFLIVMCLIVVLPLFILLTGRPGRPFVFKEVGEYEVLESIPPRSREKGDELWELLVRREKEGEVLFVGYPHAWLYAMETSKKERLEITRIKGHYLYTLYLHSVPDLAGALTSPPEEFETEMSS